MANVSMLIVMLVFFSLPGLEPWTSNSLTLSSNKLSYPTPKGEDILI